MMRWNRLALVATLMCAPLAACSTSAPAPDAGKVAETTGETSAAAKHTDAMAKEHKGDTPTPTPGSEAPPRQEVVGEEVVYGASGDVTFKGYLAKPKVGAESAPTLIVIHEWWGLNDQIRAVTRRLAGEGYVALAVDMYGKPAATTPEGAKALMMASTKQAALLKDNLKQAAAYLGKATTSDRLGTIGWCFGGGWSLQASLAMPDQVDATVIYYGRLVTEADALKPLKSPVLGLFASEDKGIPVASVRAFEASLKQLGKPHTIHVYEGANHAFANPSGTRYNKQAAEDAWARTTAFFATHLQGK